MSMKKLLVLAAAGLVSSAALAGGVGSYNAAAPALHSYTGIYIEGMAGYATTYYKNLVGTSASDDWTHGTGNWSVGADVGYQWNKYFSGELGGVYLFSSKYNDASASGQVTFKPWTAYLAGKVAVPVVDNVSLFGKFGVGYVRQKVSQGAGTAMPGVANYDTGSHWGPMFGVGVAYHWTSNIYVDGQYLRFAGAVKTDASGNKSTYVPSPNVFLLGVGYKFAM